MYIEWEQEYFENLVKLKEDIAGWVEEFSNQTGVQNLINDEIGTEIDTMGGLAFALAGHISPRGEIIAHPNGYELEIIDADPRKIRRMLFRVVSPIKAAD